jgi:hypothetical protein
VKRPPPKPPRRRRPYRPPRIVTEKIFERYALACSTKNRRGGPGYMS